VNAKIVTEDARLIAPSPSDTRRPNRSAIAPVGTSSASTPTRYRLSAAVICVNENPRSKVR